MNRNLLSTTLGLVALTLIAAAPATPPAAPRTQEFGHGPAVVILHDLGGGPGAWMPTVRKLAADHRVVLVELPGHGETPLPDPFSLDAVIASVDQVLAKQHPDSTILLANGMGGLIALLELEAHPGRVRGLAVIDAAAKAPFQLNDEQIKTFFEFVDKNYDAFLQSTYGRMGKDSAQSVAIHAQVAKVAPLTIKSYLRGALTADGAAALATIQTPFLFVATDRILAGQDWATTAKAIGYDDPAAVPLRRIHGAGYLVMQDQPDSVVAVVREFEATVSAKPAGAKKK